MNRTDNVTKLRAKTYGAEDAGVADMATIEPGAGGDPVSDELRMMKREEVAAYIASMALEMHKMAKSVGLTRLLPPLEEICYASSAASNR